ncbi:MAG: aminoacyl-tRNA hydrolase [Candidatus Marinimicrobia bacterium]|jgi:PTH1 family peptidyl-tRNA hydrolase|nr:aminoacyl-tRNA hydrolase [Candidatus Neomarinimicrobiota bacterium]MBT3947765.1 aminoacyl-tRNA hydrolase [Candidatus Neomarinimicrobiota bacterium]MBT4064613.1 aminoacyl-tRNA hydrolase [Candidatus Neomarinimicrobiota bacterium]MBT4307655.1 aminoacyl-tRNA hydrolase [Candidatus Neomarinimicrobiota bacterium]MBT4453579.1 aminoacyl-tRNA hydrolase [Candidatus Neomarinimicrobiota bacterium]
MIAIIGLGNPGDKYANTKHNAGFWVVDELIRRQKLSLKPGKGPFVFAQHQRREALMIKPTTGMNLSGIAVKDIADRWNLLPTDIHIVVDDVDLPLGSIRIRPKGGDGCHRGMENIIYQLRSDQFPRVRLGIGTDENMRPAEKFVLKPFRSDDESEAESMVKRGADALGNLLVHGLNHTMNHFNS